MAFSSNLLFIKHWFWNYKKDFTFASNVETRETRAQDEFRLSTTCNWIKVWQWFGAGRRTEGGEQPPIRVEWAANCAVAKAQVMRCCSRSDLLFATSRQNIFWTFAQRSWGFGICSQTFVLNWRQKSKFTKIWWKLAILFNILPCSMYNRQVSMNIFHICKLKPRFLKSYYFIFRAQLFLSWETLKKRFVFCNSNPYLRPGKSWYKRLKPK